MLVRGLQPETVERLEQRVKRHRSSFQGKAKLILEDAAQKVSMEEARAIADKWRKKLAATGKKFSDSAELLREYRER